MENERYIANEAAQHLNVDENTPEVIESICAASTEISNRRFLTSDEAAEFLGGLNSRTVTRWAREGYLPAFPVGEGKRRLWRFLESDLEQWMFSRRTGQLPTEIQACADTLFAATDAPKRRLLEG